MSEQQPSMEVEGIVQKMFAALKAFIIFKWKKFVTTKTLPRAVKLSNWGRRTFPNAL
jgi:hypothetical protein